MKKIFLFVLLIIAFCGISQASERQSKVSLSFFADQDSFVIEDRMKLVEFLKQHRQNDVYEFEIWSLSDPLKIGFDVQRLKNLQGIFRQYDINIEQLVSAKVRFIASDKQQLVVIRK